MIGWCVGDDVNVVKINWVVCLVVENNEENGSCFYGFFKIENVWCGRGWGYFRELFFKNLVCCVVLLVIDVKVNEENEKYEKELY